MFTKILNFKNIIFMFGLGLLGTALLGVFSPNTIFAAVNCYEQYGPTAVIAYECNNNETFVTEIGTLNPDPKKCYVKDMSNGQNKKAVEIDCASMQFADAVLPKCFINGRMADCQGAVALAKAAGQTLEVGKCYDITNSLGSIPEVECSTVVPPGAVIGGRASCPSTMEGCPGYGRTNGDKAAFESCDSLDKCDFMDKFVNPAIKFLSAGVGLIVTIMIIIAGIQYSMAGGDPQKVAAAKSKIANAILALVTYIFFFALLQWLWPGGLV